MDRFRTQAAAIAAAVGILAFAASGCGSGEEEAAAVSTPRSRAALEQYRSFLEKRATKLLARAKTLKTQIEAGDVGEAESSYAIARISYGQIEPGVESLFSRLDARIDVGAGARGLHEIEGSLWEGRIVAAIPMAKLLFDDVRKLRLRLKTTRLPVEQIIQGAGKALDEASATVVHGGREPHSKLDLVDVSANLEGVQAAFEAARPPLEEVDPDLAEEIDAEFHSAFGRLGHFGYPARTDTGRTVSAGVDFALYGMRTQTEYDKLGRKLDPVTEDLSEAATVLAP